MIIDWTKLLPVVISIVVILLVAVLRHISKELAAITATMPLNIPLALWIVSSGPDSTQEQLIRFNQSLFAGLLATLVFMLVTLIALRAGWSLLPVLAAGYAAWGLTLGLILLAGRIIGGV